MTITDTTTPRRSTVNPQLDEKMAGTLFVPVKNFQRSSETYALLLAGDCLDPIIKDGDYCVCEPSMDFGTGDFVILWPKNPAKIPVIKRLVMAPPRDWQKWTHPESEAVPACIVEMLNPRRQLRVNLGSIAAIHRVVSWGDAADVIDRQDARCRRDRGSRRGAGKVCRVGKHRPRLGGSDHRQRDDRG